MKIRFIRLTKSELITEAIEDRILPAISKFSDIRHKDIVTEIAMENSPHQAGRNLFRVKIKIVRGKMRGFTLEKSDISFYRALANITTSLPSTIKKFRSKKQGKALKQLRRFKDALPLYLSST